MTTQHLYHLSPEEAGLLLFWFNSGPLPHAFRHSWTILTWLESLGLSLVPSFLYNSFILNRSDPLKNGENESQELCYAHENAFLFHTFKVKVGVIDLNINIHFSLLGTGLAKRQRCNSLQALWKGIFTLQKKGKRSESDSKHFGNKNASNSVSFPPNFSIW